MIPRLVCTEGAARGGAWDITEQGVRLGRDPANEIALNDHEASRYHARVILHNGALWIQDAGSRNGVFVNGERVATHRALSPGDKLQVGSHHFVIELADPNDISVSVNVAQVTPPKKKWKIWPFAVAFLLIGGCVGLISLRSGESAPEPEAPAAGPAKKGGYSLADALTPEAEAPKGGPSLTDALSEATGTPKSEMETWPDPPAGVSLQELLDQGQAHYDAKRYREALTRYQMGLKLDNSCAICKVRIPKIQGEIDAMVAERYAAGVRYFDSLQYPEAIEAWETVLLLEPDEKNPTRQKAAQYLDQARELAKQR